MITSYCVACMNCSNLHNHHLLPKSKGGSDDETNLITLCGHCHSIAHDLDGSTWHNHGKLISMSKELRRDNGEHLGGGVPFGYTIKKVDGKNYLFEDEKQINAVKLVLRLYKNGWSLRRISTELSLKGIFNRTGKPMAPATVKNIIQYHSEGVV